jgi:uncharacterized protein involved in outer membrane biogenesis
MKIRIKWVLSAAITLAAASVAAGYAILSSYDFDDLKGVIEAEAEAATGRTLTIGGPISLDISWSPKIAIENVSFGNAPWGQWPEIFSIRRLEVQVGLLPLLGGNIEIQRLIAIEPSILLETNDQGDGNWVLGQDDAPASDSAPPVAIPAFHRIEVHEGRAIFRNGRSGQEILIQLERLDASADTPDSPSRISFTGSYNGVPISGAGQFASRAQLLSGTRVPLDVQLQLGPSTVTLAGEIADLAAAKGLDLAFETAGASLAEFGPILHEDLPPLGPYRFGGRLSDTENGIKIAGLAVKLGNSDLAGNATIDLSKDRPVIDATLNASALDIRDFVGRDSQTDSTPSQDGNASKAKSRIFSDESLPLQSLRTFDARVNLSASQVQADEKTNISDLSLRLDLTKGRLNVSDLRAGFSSGEVSGGASLDASKDQAPLALDLVVKNFNYGHFLLGRDVTDGVKGTLDAELSLRAAGQSPHAWAESMNGRVSLVGGEGRVRNDLLQATGAGLIDMLSGWREGDNDLKLNCVVMRLPVKDGVMETEAVLIDTEAVTVGVDGEIDLGTETLDLKVTPQAKQTSLMSLAVPLRVGGDLADPSVAPDALGSAIGVAKIAGMFINPLAAGALIIAGSGLSSDQNPCVAAIESKAKPAGPAPSQPAPQAPPGEKGALENLGEGISRGIKGLLGD